MEKLVQNKKYTEEKHDKSTYTASVEWSKCPDDVAGQFDSKLWH